MCWKENSKLRIIAVILLLAAMRAHFGKMKLTEGDIVRLKKEIKASLVISLLLFFVLCVLVAIVFGIIDLFKTPEKPSPGINERGLYVFIILLFPFILIVGKTLLIYVDILQGKKIGFQSESYEVLKKKESHFIVTHEEPKRKIKIYGDLLPKLSVGRKVTIEVAAISKTLLFISHGSENLLDKEA